MTVLLEAARFEAPRATGRPAEARDGATVRRCTVLECAAADSTVALLYVFHELESPLAGWGDGTARPAPRHPGKLWGRAIDLRPRDRVLLSDGRIAVVDKLVAAPSLAAIGAFRVQRARTYALAADGSWVATPCDAMQGRAASDASGATI